MEKERYLVKRAKHGDVEAFYIIFEWKEEAISDIAATAEADTVSGATAEADVAADSAEGIQGLSAEKDFSTTNLQEYGVDESDIVKTDGNCIYVVRDRQVQIVKISDGNMKTAGAIRPEMAAPAFIWGCRESISTTADMIIRRLLNFPMKMAIWTAWVPLRWSEVWRIPLPFPRKMIISGC
jgi:uncharacterized secreted protein with C-terminal beta-propeller domain